TRTNENVHPSLTLPARKGRWTAKARVGGSPPIRLPNLFSSLSTDHLPLPDRVFSLQEVARPIAQPGVTIAPLIAERAEVVAGHAVAVGAERPVRADLIEASPHWRSIGVFLHHFIAAPRRVAVLDRHDLDPFEFDRSEPGYRSLDRLDHFRAGIVKAHQQPDDADRLGPAGADQLEATAGTGLIVFLVVLGAPSSQLAVNLDLALEDARYSPIERLAGLASAPLVHEGVNRFGGGLAEEVHQADHGVVVEGDV